VTILFGSAAGMVWLRSRIEVEPHEAIAGYYEVPHFDRCYGVRLMFSLASKNTYSQIDFKTGKILVVIHLQQELIVAKLNYCTKS